MFGNILKLAAPAVGKLLKGKAAKSIAIGATGPTALMVVLEWWPGLAETLGDKPASYAYAAALGTWGVNLGKLWVKRLLRGSHQRHE